MDDDVKVKDLIYSSVESVVYDKISDFLEKDKKRITKAITEDTIIFFLMLISFSNSACDFFINNPLF